uniref:Secreted protein n=1 Tax=Syphacia muris TaxID=451379 RepID=A0A0N5AQ79_9BILA
MIAGSIIVPSADADKFDGLKKDIPVASGASPDDEDGDVDEGSGSSEDQFEGSGGGLMKGSVDSNSNSYSNSNRFNTNNVTLTSPTLDTTTTSVINKIDTGSKRPVDKLPPHRPFDNDYNEKEVDHDDDEEDSLNESSSRQNEDHVLIEDSSTARTVPAFKPFPTVRTTQLVTPSLSDAVDSNRIYFGTLFKPGILADSLYVVGADGV